MTFHMFRASRAFFGALCTCLTLMMAIAEIAAAQDGRPQTGPIVIPESHHDTSAPLRELAVDAKQGPSHIVLPLRRLPVAAATGSEPDAFDPVAQQTELAPVAAKIGLNFDGISDIGGAAWSDANASVGSTQIVEVVNSSFQVFDKKTGKSLLGPAELQSIFKNFSLDGCDGSTGGVFFNPVVLYDKVAKRWLITAVESDNNLQSSTECVAVSVTSDATGAYHRYAFLEPFLLDDYPKFGVWPDAYYSSSNQFLEANQFVQTEQCAYDRTNMLKGGLANAICFVNGGAFSLLPADLDGASIATKGEPNFFVDLNPNDSTSLNLYKFHVDFTHPKNTTFSGPTRIPVAPYSQACGGKFCIPQLGTAQQLDSVGDRLMFRLAYRNFGDHESLVVTHAVKGAAAAANVRWYEIRNPNGPPEVFQQGTFGSGSASLWMASIGMDKVGDIAFGFNRSSSTMPPSIGYTGRVPTDPLGTMESPASIVKGKGSQTRIHQWGTYSSISIDPVDDCTSGTRSSTSRRMATSTGIHVWLRSSSKLVSEVELREEIGMSHEVRRCNFAPHVQACVNRWRLIFRAKSRRSCHSAFDTR